MSKKAAFAGSNTAMVLSALAVVAAFVGAGLFINGRNASVPEVSGEQTKSAEPASEPAADSSTDTPQTDAGNAEASPDPDTPATPPMIDEVRVEADGLTIIAGRASPGSTVSVLLDGVENTRVTADSGGGFAAVTTIQPKTAAQILTVVQRIGDVEVASKDEIILAPTASTTQLAAVEPDIDAEPGNAPETSQSVAVLPKPQSDAEAAPPIEKPADPDVVEVAPSAQDQTQGSALSQTSEAPDRSANPQSVARDASSDSNDAPIETAAASEGVAPRSVQSAEATTDLSEDIVAEAESDGSTETDTAASKTSGAPAAQAQVEAADVADNLNGNGSKPSGDNLADVGADTKSADTVEPATEQPKTPQTVTVLKSTAEGVEVLGRSQSTEDSVAIDTISYSEKGEVQLSGRAQSEAERVRVYVNNRPISELTVDAQGRWRGDLPGIDAGVHTLRVDEVDISGNVVSRIETPFKRESLETLAAIDDSVTTAKQITVQTGATLWAIARARYGEGTLYVQIFEANRNAIRDPDLIYPGQVFDLPD